MGRARIGLGSTATGAHAGRGCWPKRAAALVAGLALALTVVAAMAASASAFAPRMTCELKVRNDTPLPLKAADSDLTGVRRSSHDGEVILPGRQSPEFWSAESYFPLKNRCSVVVKWDLVGPQGPQRALGTWVVNPANGANTFGSETGGPLYVVTDINDDGWTARAHFILKLRSAAGDSASALRAGVDPLRSAGDSAIPGLPKPVPALLRRGDLIGRGWRPATGVRDLGLYGEILAAAKVPASCQDKNKRSEPSLLKVGSSAFERRGGAEFIGAMNGIYANARQSRRMINDAVSAHSLGCLAKLLTSRRFHTSVSTEHLSVTLAGRRLILHRLKVSTRSGKRIIRTDYIDIAGLRHAKANALMMLASDKQPLDDRTEAWAIIAVARRL